VPGAKTHLWIGYRMAGFLTPTADLGAFLLGSISPDALHARDEWSRRAKRYSHLVRKNEHIQKRFARYDALWRRYKDTDQADFAWGWILHLVSDSLWSHLIGRAYWHRTVTDVPHDERRRIWYQELAAAESAIDLSPAELTNLVDALRSAVPRSFGHFMDAEVISRWRDDVVATWADGHQQTRYEAVFFTPSRVRAYANIVLDTMSFCRSDGLRAAYLWLATNYPEDDLLRY
jgi:hypothetical protein